MCIYKNKSLIRLENLLHVSTVLTTWIWDTPENSGPDIRRLRHKSELVC